jgi:DNA-binding LacI/PurR family transcriptional regulator
MEKRKTLKDIAIKLNMSISTVSKALNDDGSISSLTKVRVQKQASEWIIYLMNLPVILN